MRDLRDYLAFGETTDMDIVASAVKASGRGLGWRKGIVGGTKAQQAAVENNKAKVAAYLNENRFCTIDQIAADLGMSYKSAANYSRMVKSETLQSRRSKMK
jgi:hypothetical protein